MAAGPDDRQGGLSRRGAVVAASMLSRQAARRQAFLTRRTNTYRQVEEAVKAGTMSQYDAHAHLQRAGFVPGGTAYKKPPGWMVPELQGIADVAQTVHDAPKGAYESAKAVGLDLRDSAETMANKESALFGQKPKFHPPPGGPFQRTRQLGRYVVGSLAQDVQHPLRHPGYTALDVLGAYGGEAKLARAAGRVARKTPDVVREVRAEVPSVRAVPGMVAGEVRASMADRRTVRAAGYDLASQSGRDALQEMRDQRFAAGPMAPTVPRPARASVGRAIVDVHKQAYSPANLKRVGKGSVTVTKKTGKFLGRRAVPLAKSPEGNAALLRIEQSREHQFQAQRAARARAGYRLAAGRM